MSVIEGLSLRPRGLTWTSWGFSQCRHKTPTRKICWSRNGPLLCVYRMSLCHVVMMHENSYSVVLVRAYLISSMHGADSARMHPTLADNVWILAPYHPAIRGRRCILELCFSAANAAEAQWRVETTEWLTWMTIPFHCCAAQKASMSSYLPRLHFQQMLATLRSFSFYRVPLFYQTTAVSCSPPSLYHLQWPVFLQAIE